MYLSMMLRIFLLLLISARVGAQDSLYLSTAKPTSFWDDEAVTLAGIIKAPYDGKITALKFYKTTVNTAPILVTLWSMDGTGLTQMEVSNGRTGWQRLPVSIQVSKDQSYVIGYRNPRGIAYGYKNNAGVKGLYSYSTGFPNKQVTTDYFVDMVFSQSLKPLIVNAGRDTVYTWPVASITLNGFVSGDGVTYKWTVIDSFGTLNVTGLNTLHPVLKPKPDSGGIFLLTGTDSRGVTSEHDVYITVTPDFNPYLNELASALVEKFGAAVVERVMNEIRLMLQRRWRGE